MVRPGTGWEIGGSGVVKPGAFWYALGLANSGERER